ncbi:MAG: DUF1554 domain-containing protein [Leptospiraceae bacterium]|nr:DUF1554 domain-containing protein [Leptospiraceae bacterium]
MRKFITACSILFLITNCVNNNLGNRFIDSANGEWGLRVFVVGNFSGNLAGEIPVDGEGFGIGCSGSATALANCYCTNVATVFTSSKKKYYAWLSDSSTDAICNVQGLTGKNCEVQNYSNVPLISLTSPTQTVFPVISDNLQELISANFRAPLSTINDPSWTGSNNQGIGQSDNCQNWTSNNVAVNGVYGQPDIQASWSQIANGDCATNRKLICFEGPLN